ncbi:hypothetical protein SAMD00019534_002860 [Acytostelium subglobosum LB1]|uniref:hypothetical protein n=1 Tax=Acytostelium subglobosum LB1 TaxID=1410327 RepID=UPI000644EA9E|nr:hypothetical protein SAMD00019534_002860 [Acytostelium subglobosum LB1]GAM17111.1 hypothetical protein SAMD00019534_002860 [Acytostelium subglobosum LB1]|eukprot:XP_012759173.1 hypothetical protein SAMD00019534_002860 [Acytostelium subglobosum LB1]
MFGGVRLFKYASCKSSSINSSRYLYNNVSITTSLNQSVARLYSTVNNNTAPLPKMRNILKQFYLLVHPDTLTHHPEEKKVNSHNMKIIMGVIDQFKKRPMPDPNTQPISHALTFFIPEKDVLKATTQPLRRVDIEVIENSRNPNHVPDQLALLFGQCELPTRFITEINQVDNFKQPKINGSIKDFLLDNRQFARQMSTDAQKERRDLEGMLRKLRRELEVNVTMNVDPVESTFTFQENYTALQDFADIYQEWKAAVSPAYKRLVSSMQFNLNYSETNYTSNDPTVYLDRASPESWKGYLSRMDLRELEDQVKQEREEGQKKMASFTKHKKEFDNNSRELTKLLKVRAVNWRFHDDPSDDPHAHLGQNDQMELCESFSAMLLKNKVQIQKIVRTNNYRLNGLNIGISPNLKKADYYIDMDGTLKISTRCSVNQFMEIIGAHHEEALKVQKESDRIEQLRDYVQVRLGLKELTTINAFVYAEGYDKVFKAYQKLHEESEKLRNLELNGLCLIIADYYSISRAGEIFIKWDFSVEDFIAALSAPKEEAAVPEQSSSLEQDDGTESSTSKSQAI